ncbi:hypothetical protein [Hyphomicrobium sp.]|uniref:hypothetical protein n=1 Tax=Hyphomicrobium sp. TaxID=82 RepID=UPI002E36E5D0|nr:hypothetical protein [Hyphomicrobium sp.]HEX2842037.1 hypothetical protein [Hyphomicrobium sp.]
MHFAAGQSWSYRAPQGFESSRLLIGAIATFNGNRNIICSAVIHAPRRHADGHIEMVTIPFLPMTDAALAASVVSLCDAAAELPENFVEKLQEWSNDPKGLTAFTVPFEGFLDQMIAHQMAEIAGLSAA